MMLLRRKSMGLPPSTSPPARCRWWGPIKFWLSPKWYSPPWLSQALPVSSSKSPAPPSRCPRREGTSARSGERRHLCTPGAAGPPCHSDDSPLSGYPPRGCPELGADLRHIRQSPFVSHDRDPARIDRCISHWW